LSRAFSLYFGDQGTLAKTGAEIVNTKWAIYVFTLLLSLPIPVLCLERDENGHWQPNDDPPVTLIFGLAMFASAALGIQIPREAIAQVLHLPNNANAPPPNNEKP
jgi:hypothetical protein